MRHHEKQTNGICYNLLSIVLFLVGGGHFQKMCLPKAPSPETLAFK